MPTRIPILYGPLAVLERTPRRVTSCCCCGFFFILITYIYISYGFIAYYFNIKKII